MTESEWGCDRHGRADSAYSRGRRGRTRTPTRTLLPSETASISPPLSCEGDTRTQGQGGRPGKWAIESGAATWAGTQLPRLLRTAHHPHGHHHAAPATSRRRRRFHSGCTVGLYATMCACARVDVRAHTHTTNKHSGSHTHTHIHKDAHTIWEALHQRPRCVRWRAVGRGGLRQKEGTAPMDSLTLNSTTSHMTASCGSNSGSGKGTHVWGA